MVVQRARMLRATSDRELKAFLTGLRCAQTAAVNAAEELYDVADSATGGDRQQGNGRAAGAKLVSERIGALFDAAARATETKPSRKGFRALLAQLTGSD